MVAHCTGSGPYCYANSPATLLDDPGFPPDLLEVLTGSPFGFQLLAGGRPEFDPYGGDPGIGIDRALAAAGYTCRSTSGGTAEQAERRLRDAVAPGPVFVGPVEMGLFAHQPGMTEPIAGDHFVVVLDVDDTVVTFRDPQWYPYATLPVPRFLATWRAETIGYGRSYSLRADFRRAESIDPVEAVRGSGPWARELLACHGEPEVRAGTLGSGAGVSATADLLAAGPDPELLGHLRHFAVRVGARRLSDAARWLDRAGLPEASSIAAEQSRLVGRLQYDVTAGDPADAAATLRRLAPGYARWHDALA